MKIQISCESRLFTRSFLFRLGNTIIRFNSVGVPILWAALSLVRWRYFWRFHLRKILLSFPLLALLVACNGLTPDPEIYRPDYEPESSVFGVISPNAAYEFVLVERPRRLDEAFLANTIIENAKVIIASEEGSTQFTYSRVVPNFQGGLYVDRSNSFRAVPGETYTLVIDVPDGRRVTGSTRVPLTPNVLKPDSSYRLSRLNAAETTVDWERDAEAAAYRLSLRVYDRIYRYWFNVLNHNEVIVSPPVLLDQLSEGFYSRYDSLSKTAIVEVMVMDRNYYDYIRSNTDLAEITGTSLSLVEGGVGVFGSLNFASASVMLE